MTAKCFLNNVFRFCGLPDSLVSDQGSAFISTMWRNICIGLNINHKLSSTHHPQTDGQSERANQAMEVYLRHFVNQRQDDWAEYLPIAEFCINNHVNSSTGVTPFFASFGHHPRLDFMPESQSPARYRPQFVRTIGSVQRQCCEAITHAQAFMASYANQKRLPAPRYKPGDYVFLSTKNLRRIRPCAKLDNLRDGPYKITAMKTPLVAKLDLPPDLKVDNNFHVNLLRPANPSFP